MENRLFKRITAGYKTDIIYSGGSCPGVIENLSERGVNVITDPIDGPVQFNPGEVIMLRCEIPSGELIEFTCRIKWSGQASLHNTRRRIGAEIVDPPWQKNEHFL